MSVDVVDVAYTSIRLFLVLFLIAAIALWRHWSDGDVR
jgi:hypothetical protein